MGALRIGIAGVAGRMGRALVAEACAQDGCTLAGGSDAPGSPAIGQPIHEPATGADTGKVVLDDTAALCEASDVVIDFTVPAATAQHARLAGETATPLVIGTTGLEADHQAAIDRAAARVPVVQAANFSLGVNLLLALTRLAAARLDDRFDIEIVEMHHRHKVDAPSGTALALGQAAAEGRGVDLAAVADRGRDGITEPRTDGHIGFAVLRGGDVAGEHSVVFAGQQERVELTHRATDRAIFARGAVSAAVWAAGRPAGLYSMADVLDLGG